jgi:hypothetical protein
MQQDPSEDHNLIKDPASRGIVDAMMEGHVRPFLSTAPLRPHPVSRSKRH